MERERASTRHHLLLQGQKKRRGGRREEVGGGLTDPQHAPVAGHAYESRNKCVDHVSKVQEEPEMTRNHCEEALNVRRCEQGRGDGGKPGVESPQAAAELLVPVVWCIVGK